MPFSKSIPGETPITDISELKVKDILYRSQLNRVEAINITKATARYLVGPITRQVAPFDFAWLCQLHREMFGDVWGWSGRLRTTVTTIGIQPALIEARLFELTQNLPCWKDEPPLQQAARLHHQAVQIHPFENGNGRWSRLLANIWLRLNRHQITAWPPSELSDVSPIRDEYIEAIKAADNGDEGPLRELHKRYSVGQ